MNHPQGPITIFASSSGSGQANQGMFENFLSQIRDLVSVTIEPDDLPDTTIGKSVFLRNAELKVYEKLQLASDAAYDALSDADKERIRIAVMYRAAIGLMMVLPQIIESQIQSERIRLAEIDWEQKMALYLNQSDEILEDVDDYDGPTTVVATLINKTVPF